MPFLQRLFDISIAIFSLILLSPLLAICCASILCFDSRPFLFKQTRVGKDCKIFSIFKFRTMINRDNADSNIIQFTTPNDPRITPIGSFLRKTSLDELPQLLNVISGDMSIVGPRPDHPSQESSYSQSEWSARHKVRPGITGLAQISGRSSLSAEDRKRYDLQYVEKKSILFDIVIILRTIKNLIRKQADTN